MIVRMKKLTLLCMASEQEATLSALRDLGVIHLAHIEEPRGADIEQARTHLAHVHRAMDSIPKHPHGEPSGRSADEVVEDIWSFLHVKKELTERSDFLKQERLRVGPYGSFDPGSIKALAEKGIHVRLFQVGPKQDVPVLEDKVLTVLGSDKNGTYFAVIGEGDFEVEATELRLPEMPLADMDTELETIQNALDENHEKLEKHACDYRVVAEFFNEAHDNITYLEARAGMGKEKHVAYLRGFCPEESIESIQQSAAANGWAVLVDDPGVDDPVPTLIRNPKWVSMIRPVFDFMGILPGYKEVDISACFLFFFSLFFGMIVGDAGYGLIFLVGTLFARKAIMKSAPAMFPLMLVMSVCTIVWGALTGCWFSLSESFIPAVLIAPKVAWLTDNNNIMFLCFTIGAVHLTIAHGWGAIQKINSSKALGDLGWICVTWMMYFVINWMVLKHDLPAPALVLGCVGVVLIASSIIISKEWSSLVMLALDLISAGVDIVSYVRLFAVGLATYAVGNAFNGMIIGDGIHGILGGLLAAVFLFLAHALNIVMAAMGVLVHGIRLNTLEFSGHLGLEWSGQKYTPFRKKRG
ncbi:MAG: hypothetical protein KJ626_16015 [Verrucomicrobia bacterium]|nr:hypothetical protein [Verrucomicrobiota bacterium]